MAGKKCASDDNESNRAPTAPHDAAAKVSTEAGRNQSDILQEPCCLNLKDNVVHQL